MLYICNDIIKRNYLFTDKNGTNLSDGIIDMRFTYNNNSNLSHIDENYYPYSRTEEFYYDNLNRLMIWNPYESSTQFQVTYHPQTGNITSKTDVGSNFQYGANNGKPHALTSITSANGSVVPSTNLLATYTDFKKIKTLTEGNKLYTLSYGVDEQRTKSVYAINGATQLTRYYLGNYEEEVKANGNIRKIHYLPGAVFIQNNGKDSLLFIYKDHLGSLTALTDASGNVLERYAYDPWGMRRNPNDWSQKDTRTSFLLNRGFTMHEHLDAFGIINMNGRVYDPLTGIFFSPDPYVQAHGDWLNYNRYSYVWNNPLLYVDPSGEFVEWIALAMLVYMGGIQANVSHCMGNGTNPFNPVSWNWSSANTYIGMAQGAMMGLSLGWGIYIPNTQIPGMIPNGALQAGIQVTLNGIGNITENRKFFDNWYWSAGMGFVSGAIIGYELAKASGLNPLTGGGYQKALDNAVAKEGINNPKSKFLVANKKNAQLVSDTYNKDIKVSGSKIIETFITPEYITEEIYDTALNFGSQEKGNMTLVTKQAIRNKAYFSLTDVIRHEGTHQLQILAGMTDVVSMEYGAYMTNILNPATPTTILKTFNVLTNTLQFNSSTLWETILNIYPYGPIP